MTHELQESAKRIQDILKKHGLDIKVIEFKELTRTAQEAADVIGCEVGQIAKSLIFKGKKTGKPICIIASGKNRVDEKKVELLVGEPIERSDADFVRQHTGFAIGGIPPIGFTFDVLPLVDEDLLGYKEMGSGRNSACGILYFSGQSIEDYQRPRCRYSKMS